MKMMKWALLGGAAVAVTATAARADDLSALKAQIEQLQTRVSQLEAQPQAAMPSGYSLLSIRDGQGTFQGDGPARMADQIREDSGFTLSVVPTADAAPVAEVSVSGEIRTVLIYSDFDATEDDNLDVKVRGRLNVRGKVDTAVGEVGGHIRLAATGGGNFTDYSESAVMDKAYAWWQFAPEWNLRAGYDDNTGALQAGWDWSTSSPTKTFGPSNVNNEQLRLTYSSGPLSFAISLEDPDGATTAAVAVTKAVVPDGTDVGTLPDTVTTAALVKTSTADRSDIPNVQGYLMYSSDTFTGQILGLYQDDNLGSDDWAVGAAAILAITDGFQVQAGGVVGEGTSSFANNVSPLTVDEGFWGASLGIFANLSEDTRLELGVGYEDYDDAGTALGFGGGIYWDPVSQVTLGIGATYIDKGDTGKLAAVDGADVDLIADHVEVVDADDNDSLEIFFGTWLRFP